MRLSARNQLQGTVVAIEHGRVMSTVEVALGDGQTITAAVTREAVDSLGLTEGSPATVVIKATSVMLGAE